MESCKSQFNVETYETSAEGHQLKKMAKITPENESEYANVITINPEKTFQKILGFGGAFTQSSAYLYSKLGQKNKEKVIL